MARDPNITDAQYTDPRIVALYDSLNRPDAATAMFERLVGAPSKRVLDLGCGTGLLASRLATSGHVVTGVDPATAMLDVARRDPRVRWIEADARTLALPDRFDVAVMTGHAFQVFITDDDIAAVLATARRHADVFIFDTRNPDARGWERWGTRTLPGVTVRYEVRDVTGDLVHLATHHDLGGEVIVTHSVLRFLAEADVIARVRAAGFTSIATHGAPDEIVVVAH